jgi:preprotein translocase subunit SecD
VSDYKAYVQNLDNQNYIVVEIGGIADLDQAKGLIGKTLELEFKLQNPETPTAKTIAVRMNAKRQIIAKTRREK